MSKVESGRDQGFKGWWKKESPISLSISVVSAVVATFGMGISIRADRRAEEDRISDRLIILTGGADAKNDTLALAPIDPAFKLLHATVNYPKEFDKQTWQVYSPANKLAVLVPRMTLRELLQEKVRIQRGFTGVIPSLQVPLVVEADYVVHGERFNVRGLYNLEYEALISPRLVSISQRKLRGLTFQRFVEATENSDELLGQLWPKMKPRQP